MTKRWIGTSGFSYPEWKGSFYPEKLPQKKMFGFYVEHFPTVEINNTFYKMPDEALIKGWSESAPAGFRFGLKAPQRITHVARLKDIGDTVRFFLEKAALLGDKLGPILFQLPPNMKKDAGRLAAFLADIPAGTRAAFEFRNASWFDDEVFELLKKQNLALCISDSEKISAPFVATADYGYLRLRDEGYEPADIGRWHELLGEKGANWTDAFVYFKHEDAGKGPAFAKALMALG